MSLMVTFNGQFKPYRTEPKNRENVHRIRQMAPSFNDLVEHYVDKDLPDRPHKGAGNTSDKKNKISSYTDNRKTKKTKVYAKDIMSTKIYSLSSQNTILEAMDLLSKYKIQHIPIIDNNVLVGIVSDRLLLNIISSNKSTSTALKEVMVKEVLIGQLHSSISDISRVMLDEQIHSIPIVSDNLEVKGIVTSSDILELLIHSFPLEVYA